MKYYVVWEGRKPGIYETWEECKAQVHKYSKAKYKSFGTKELAEIAFSHKAEDYVKYPKGYNKITIPERKPNRNREPLPKVNFPKLR